MKCDLIELLMECDCSSGNFTHSILPRSVFASNKWIQTLPEIIFIL